MTRREDGTVAGDDTCFGSIMKLVLQRPGCYRVLACMENGRGLPLKDGQGAWTALTDIRMTTMNARGVAEQLLEDCFAGNAPMVYLTGIAKQIALEEAGWYLPGYPFLAKPHKTGKQTRRIGAVFAEEE